jgi:hypothetical protein
MTAFVLNERLRPGVLGAVSLGLCGVTVIRCLEPRSRRDR